MTMLACNAHCLTANAWSLCPDSTCYVGSLLHTHEQAPGDVTPVASGSAAPAHPSNVISNQPSGNQAPREPATLLERAESRLSTNLLSPAMLLTGEEL